MLLMIDNYDSFTYNLVQYFGELNAKPVVVRNDQITLRDVQKMRPSQIVISPGPCTPNEAGISCDVIRQFSGVVPLLGVCLGHQSIGQVFGGKIIRARKIMHGKISLVSHDRSGIFAGLPNPFQATRYHSLLIERKSCPQILKISAWTQDGEIMGVTHRSHPTWGVQFHPESIMTPEGKDILRNFLRLAAVFEKKQRKRRP